MTVNVQEVLEDRVKVYGNYKDKALFIQRLKSILRSEIGWCNLEVDQKESLDMIIHKMARILIGNPDHKDSWVDIAGYAMLIANRLDGKDA